MSYLEELKKHINSLFEKAEDKKTVDALASTMKLFENVEQEQKQMEQEKKELLDDYKDVVLHSSYKPNKEDSNSDPQPFDSSKAMEDAIEKFSKK